MQQTGADVLACRIHVLERTLDHVRGAQRLTEGARRFRRPGSQRNRVGARDLLGILDPVPQCQCAFILRQRLGVGVDLLGG